MKAITKAALWCWWSARKLYSAWRERRSDRSGNRVAAIGARSDFLHYRKKLSHFLPS